MEMILRIQYANKIEDYDLSVVRQDIKVGAFQASWVGGWQYRCGGEGGQLQPGNVILIDANKAIAALVLEKVQGRTVFVELADGITIGRKPDNQIALKDNLISSRHCRIVSRSGKWYVEDLGSTNGTFLNDRRVSIATLNPGDVLKLGRYRLKVGKQLCLENMDSRVTLSIAEAELTPQTLCNTQAYPWFSRAPRLLSRPKPLAITIENAPPIGGKPTIGLGGISFNPASMALSLANQALRYGFGKKKYSKQEKLRDEVYANYLNEIEARLQLSATQQRDYEKKIHPSLKECMDRVREKAPNLWERLPGDDDFLSLRLGSGSVPTTAQIKYQPPHLQLQECVLDKIPEQMAEKYAKVDDCPIYSDLCKDGNCGIVGQRNSVVWLAWNWIAQLTALHSYDEVKLVVFYPAHEQQQWEWVRWLPHCQTEKGDLRLLASSNNCKPLMEYLERALQQRLEQQDDWENGFSRGNIPHYVFLVADPNLPIAPSVGKAIMRNDPQLGVTGIFLGRSLSDVPHNIRNIVEVYDSDHLMLKTTEGQIDVTADSPGFSLEQFDAFARAMAPIRLSGTAGGAALPESISFLSGLGICDLKQLDLGELWDNSCNYQSMAVPIGVRANAERFLFDIHEKMHGPHGVVAGMTGSGKSEMVMSWILSMAMHFSPQDVSFVLIDFKGTGLILPFENLPHLAGTISDLDTNISRNLVALNSELDRRKALLDAAGVNKISDYLKLYRSGKVSEPLPYLFVVIDEYAEFKSQFPDFTNSVNSLFRTGRSLGVHIILLTQNPAGVVSAESESNVRFRWCLKVASTGASKEMLGTHNDAAYLTNPGRAYIQVGSDEVFELVQSYYSGAPYQPDAAKRKEQSIAIYKVATNGTRSAIRPDGDVGQKHGKTEINAVVQHIRDYAMRNQIPDARRIWQDRMPDRLILTDLLEAVPVRDQQQLLPVVGMVDDPARQVQNPLILPLSTDGHVAVIGEPSCGKTVFLQTLAVSLCRSYSPDQVNIYCMDFGNWTMSLFRDYPHVCAVANSNEDDKLVQMAEAISRELQHRKESFAREGADSLRTYMRMTGDTVAYIVLLVDKFELAKAHPGLEDFFLKVGREGQNYGIILVLTGTSSSAMGYKLEQNIKTKLAMLQSNPSDYLSVLGKTGGLYPEQVPGRGLIKDDYAMEFQIALPVDVQDKSDYALALRDVGNQLVQHWGSRSEQPMRVMPETIAFDSVQAQNGGLVLGICSNDLQVLETDFESPHYLLISGIPGSGKTTLLQALARQAASAHGTVAVFSDGWQVDGAQLMTTGTQADAFLAQLRDELVSRQNRKKEDPNTNLDPMYLFIDGYRRFFDEISQQSADRLKALLLAGGGLGVKIVVSDGAASLAALEQFKEPVVTILSRGPRVALGGNAINHQALALNLSLSDKQIVLNRNEGWYCFQDKTVRFKAIDCK